MNKKYNAFIQLVQQSYAILVNSGAFRRDTLDQYIARTRKPRPVTIMLISTLLGQKWQQYLP